MTWTDLQSGDPLIGEDSAHQAQVSFLYRKFYRETETGQLTVLREDAPVYHYPEGRWPTQRFQVIAWFEKRLVQIEWLLVILALLLVLLVLF